MNMKTIFGKHSNERSIFYDIILLICFVILGTVGRTVLVGWGLQPFPNFEIIMVVTFLAALFIRPTIAFLVPFFSMILSDFLLGNTIFVGNQMNRIVLFTYSGFLMISLISIFKNHQFKRRLETITLSSIGFAGGLGVLFALIYDTWTNIGWWYLMYPHTPESLIAVFVAGIPFMIYHLLSSVFMFIAVALPVIFYASVPHEITLPKRLPLPHKIPVLALTLLLIVLSFTGTAMQLPAKTDIWLEQSDETSVTLIITGSDWEVTDHICALEGDTVFSVLERAVTRNDLAFQSTYYEEFNSVIVDAIGPDENGEHNCYWQFLVNGQPSTIGCDEYMVSNGDVVEWAFKPFSR